MSIRKLPPEVANRIAAGEVIERPASIVKELIENSIDSGARRIGIEIAGGGVSLIRVRDDGCGIGRDQLAIAFERHATSKLLTADDLWAIQTLGFRGEALPSIAAAAGEVEMTSRPTGELAGARILLRNGAIVAQGDHGSASGTTVTVRDVFANQPARRAFLRSEASETRAILNVVSNAALANPEVAFLLSANDRALLRNVAGDLREAAVAVYGRAASRDLIEAGSDHADVRVRGLVATAGQHRASRSGIALVVNGRPVGSRSLTYAVEEAYQGLLPRGRHPIAVLHIDVPAETVDVNVHPTKAQVRFRDERAVFGAVQRAVRDALLDAAPVAASSIVIAVAEPETPDVRGEQPHSSAFLPGQPPLSERLRAPSMPQPSSQREFGDSSDAPQSLAFPPLRAVGQVGDLYIVAEGPDGMYLVDQHAAHERVLFERFRAKRAERQSESQMLLAPVTFDLSPRQALLLAEGADALAALGFDIAPFGEGGVIVRAVPKALADRVADPERAVSELLDALGDGRDAEDNDRAAATLACHASVRAGMTLSPDEQRTLLRLLEDADQPRTCPHGRPTMIHLSTDQLARGFGRR